MSDARAAADFHVRGWRNRLRVLFTGRAASVTAYRPPVVVRTDQHGWSANWGAFPGASYSAPAPVLMAEWEAGRA